MNWKKLLNDSISDFGKILDTQFVDEIISYIADKSQCSQGVKLVRDFNTYLKEQQSFSIQLFKQRLFVHIGYFRMKLTAKIITLNTCSTQILITFLYIFIMLI